MQGVTLPFKYPNIQAFQHSNIPTFQHSNIPTFNHSTIQAFKYPNIQAFQHSNIPTFQHSNIQTFQHSSIASINSLKICHKSLLPAMPNAGRLSPDGVLYTSSWRGSSGAGSDSILKSTCEIRAFLIIYLIHTIKSLTHQKK